MSTSGPATGLDNLAFFLQYAPVTYADFIGILQYHWLSGLQQNWGLRPCCLGDGVWRPLAGATWRLPGGGIVALCNR